MKFIPPLGNYVLQDRLLNWKDCSSWIENWDWFSGKSNNFIYQKQKDGSWHRHLKSQNSHRCYHKEYLIMLEIPQVELHRVSVSVGDRDISLINCSSRTNIELEKIERTKVYDSITFLPPKIDWFTHSVESYPTTHLLKESIIEGSASIVSNSSYSLLIKTDAFTWIIPTPDGKE